MTTSEKLDQPSKYCHLRPEEVDCILSLKRVNPEATLQEIADAVGRSTSTVHYWLSRFTDTTEDAQKVLQADALPAALKLGHLMREAKNEKVQLDAARANLTANKLLGEHSTTAVAVQVVLGVPANVTPEGNT